MQPPSLIDQAFNLTTDLSKTLKSMALGGRVLVESATAGDRSTVCSTCDSFKNGRCMECGCWMPLKVHLVSSSCPKKKWAV